MLKSVLSIPIGYNLVQIRRNTGNCETSPSSLSDNFWSNLDPKMAATDFFFFLQNNT